MTPGNVVTAGVSVGDDELTRVVQWVENSEYEGFEERERSERDRDYYDGRQITEEEADALKARKQPVIAFNLVKGKIDYMLGLEKQQRSDPKAYPRNPDDESAADAATDGIRFVCDANVMPMIASGVWEEMIVEGAGGCDVSVEPGSDPNNLEIKITPVHWDRMIWDRHSREKDFSDAGYLGVVTWMDEADALARWPDARDVIETSYSEASSAWSQTWDDRPRWVWADRDRRRVRVVQLYWRIGDAWRCGTFTRGGWLEQAKPSPYIGEDGEPCCPLEFVAAYVNRENWRYGVVRDLVDPQDEINKRHQKAVHLLGSRQITAEEGAVRDVDEARKQAALPDGFLEVAPGMRFEINNTQDLSAGQVQLLQEAKQMFQTMGPNAALMGKQGGDPSGRAIALSQQGGAMEIGAVLDIHRAWRRRVYRAVWNRIKQYWTAEKWVRVTDDEDKLRWVGLNRPVRFADKLLEMPVEEARAIAAQMGLTENDPRLAEIVGVENDVSKLDIDIVVEEGPDVATLQQEEFAKIAELAKAGVPIPPDVLIQASGLRGKDKIVERLKSGGVDPNEPPPPPTPDQIEAAAKAKEAEAKAAEAEARAMMAQIEVQRMQMGLDLAPPPAAAPAEAAPMPMLPPEPIQLPPEFFAALEQQQAGILAALEQVAGAMGQGHEQIAQMMQENGARSDAGHGEARDALAELARLVAAPTEVVRDKSGRVAGARKVLT